MTDSAPTSAGAESPASVPGLSIIDDEAHALLVELQLATAINKIKSGQTINAHERELIKDARARAQKSQSTPSLPEFAPVPSLAASTVGPAPALAVAAQRHTRTDIAALYSPEDPPAFFRTYNRCNVIGSLPAVNCPPPWHSPAALAEWYRVHYRSDPTKPAPSAPKSQLPGWLRAAIARGRSLTSPAGAALIPQNPPDPSELPFAPPAAAHGESSAAAGSDPGAVMSNTDALTFARQLLERIRLRYEAVKHLPDQAPAAERAYFDAYERVQQAERRARDAGDTETELRRLVDARIDAVHHRLPRHLSQELAALRLEIHRASAHAETFPAWCAEFYAAVGERLSRHRTLISAA